MSVYVGLTREGLALKLLEYIMIAEKKDAATADRSYTLDLLREVMQTIDGKRPYPSSKSGTTRNVSSLIA